MRKTILIPLTLLALLVFVIPAIASPTTLVVFPGATQAASVNVTANDFYFSKGDSTNLYLYLVEPSDADFSVITANSEIIQKVIYPNGTIASLSPVRFSGTVMYPIEFDDHTTANWYSSNITFDQEGVYYIYSSQKGYNNQNTLVRERNSFTVLYVGNNSTGWDNLQKLGRNVGSAVVVYPITEARNIKSDTPLSFYVDGNFSWFEQEVERPAHVRNPLPVKAAEYLSPFKTTIYDDGIDIDGSVRSNTDPVASFTLPKEGVWTIVALNERGDDGRDNFQVTYVLPVQQGSTFGNTAQPSAPDSSPNGFPPDDYYDGNEYYEHSSPSYSSHFYINAIVIFVMLAVILFAGVLACFCVVCVLLLKKR